MEYRQLGATGTRVSELCFGTWRFGRRTNGVLETDEDDAHELLDTFADHGGTFIDGANIYGDPNGTSESYIGSWLETRDRERYVLTSKVYFEYDEANPNASGLSRTHIRNQIDKTLDNLGTDYLDLYYIHRWDENTPIEETLSALTDLVEDGRVNYLGASTMAAWQLTKALWKAESNDYQRFDVVQPLFHAGYYEDVEEYLSVAADQDLAVCPYSPLAGGFLTGKYERADPDDPKSVRAPDGSRGSFDDRFERFYLSERGWKVLDEIRAVADEVDATPAQVSLRWLMDQDAFTCVPIIGARTVDQLEENVAAAEVSITDDQHDRITDARYNEDGVRWGH
jgi:Predicted oxidoreductases (related to aryl-alcohol dehydrogenases)